MSGKSLVIYSLLCAAPVVYGHLTPKNQSTGERILIASLIVAAECAVVDLLAWVWDVLCGEC
ncbi:MAG: hypothetical protein JW941_07245 [Candidatus Coatesbacteria bacterium]|nr:hypothetical protein [Candidatus Coatesbacteria bacterium]